MKKATAKPCKTPKAKPSSSVKNLMDTEAQITDPSSSSNFSNLRFNLYGSHIRGEDIFPVVDSGLYYQIAPLVHHFSKFVPWITETCIDDHFFCLLNRGQNTWGDPKLIRKALVYPISYEPQKFNKTTFFYHYTTLPADEQQSLLQMVLALGL